jgi:hypothetical protein
MFKGKRAFAVDIRQIEIFGPPVDGTGGVVTHRIWYWNSDTFAYSRRWLVGFESIIVGGCTSPVLQEIHLIYPCSRFVLK